MRRFQLLAISTILLSPVLWGCNTQPVSPTPTQTRTASPTNTPTSSPTPTETHTPTPSFTPSPTNTETPTLTSTPSPAPTCDADELLKDIKVNFQYDEFEVFYNIIQGTSTLTIWYVDQDINPDASGDEIEQNVQYALRNAALVSQQLARQNPCIEELFTVINPIVVDENYNGWFSGQVDPANLPASENPSESELESIANAFKIGYMRTSSTEPEKPGPSGSCTWIETREKIQLHFSTDRENVSFYFVIDDLGANVWAQWDGPTDILALASILNIAMELDCLHPSPTQLLFVIVDENGKVGLIGMLPSEGIKSMDTNQIKILFKE